MAGVEKKIDILRQLRLNCTCGIPKRYLRSDGRSGPKNYCLSEPAEHRMGPEMPAEKTTIIF